ncbi:MAG: cytoplasmic protein [Pseudomonadota bacterium]
MAYHRHNFVENYQGFVGFGLDRVTDEASLIVYLQKFSDDELLAVLRPRLSDEDIDEIIDLINRLLRRHLNDGEYHRLFLKEPPQERSRSD